MLYKSSNRSYSHNFIFLIITTLSLTLFFQGVNGQAQCGKRPFPSKIPLNSNENIIINLDSYFDGNNLSYTVIPNNNYSSLQPSYQCKPVGSERTGSIIKTRYQRVQNREILVALTNSQYSEGVFSLFVYQLSNLKMSSFNIPKQDVATCNEFDFQIINSTHFSTTVDCRYTKKFVTRALLRGSGTFESVYIDWTLNIAPLFAYSNIITRLQMTQQILLRGVFSATNSYIEVWSWSGQVRQLQMVIDKTFLNRNRFNGKAMKLYGKLLLVLDYQQGLILMKLQPTNFLSIVGIVSSPFHDDFQYNFITGVLQLMKKGKIVSMLLNPSTLELSSTGESYNIYKYQDIRGVITTDSTVIALGASAVNVFRKISSVSETRHSSVFFVPGVQNIYSRSVENGITLLLVQSLSNNLQVSSCSVRPPFLKLSNPPQSFIATVTATSVIQGQHSVCSQNFTVAIRAGSEDSIYDNGYQLDDEVIYANPEGFGIIQLAKYGVGRNLSYSFRTIAETILKKETKVRKSLRSNCSFQNKVFRSGTNIRFVQSWQNMIVIQFTSENTLRYYICSSLNCKYAIDYYRIQPILQVAHETIRKIKNITQIFQALLQQSQRTSSIIVRQITTDISSGDLDISQLCLISYTGVGEYWNVTQLQISNGQLYVVLGARKQIRIYDLHQKGCPNILNLNIYTCPWGYFAPQSIHFNKASKTVLPSQTFIIRQWDELLTVRINKQESLVPVLVARNRLPLVVNYSLIYTQPYLITFDLLSNRSSIFYFDDKGNVQFLRELLLEGRRFRISDSGKANFFKLIDPRHLVFQLEGQTGQNYSVALFKIDQLISPASEYTNWVLKMDEKVTWAYLQGSWQMLRLSLMSSPTLSTLLCSANTTYLQPTLQLFFGRLASYVEEYSQNVTLMVSSGTQVKTHDFKVTLSNSGDSIKRGRSFPPRQYQIHAKQQFAIVDSKWFLGSIFDYEFDCLDCSNRIQFKQKIQLQSTSSLQTPSNYFWQERNGKTVKILMGSFLMESRQNQSYWPIENLGTDNFQLLSGSLLTTSGGQCLNAVSSRRGNQIIALCERTYSDGQQLHYLTLVSTVSYRHFVIAETLLDIPLSDTPKLLVKNDMIIIYSESVAYLYTLWLVEQGYTFINLDVIDREDIDGTICSLDISYNDTVQHAPINEILYSLVVTQCSSSIYFTSFLVYIQKQEYIDQDGVKKISQVPNLHTSSAQLISLISRLRQNHIQIPSEANIIQTISNRMPGDRISIISVFDRFHTYEFIVQLSRSGVAFNISIDKIFYKYGDYEAVSVNVADYLAVKYKSRLLGREERYALFDYKGEADGRVNAINQYFSFSAYSFQNNAGTNEVPWSMRNSSIIQLQSDRIESISINDTLRGSIKNFKNDILYTQKLQITANNLDSARTAVIVIKNIDKFELEGWQIFLIVLGAIILVVATIFGLRFSIRKFRKVRKMVPLVQDARLQQSLLTLQEEERASANLSIIRSEEPQKQK